MPLFWLSNPGEEWQKVITDKFTDVGRFKHLSPDICKYFCIWGVTWMNTWSFMTCPETGDCNQDFVALCMSVETLKCEKQQLDHKTQLNQPATSVEDMETVDYSLVPFGCRREIRTSSVCRRWGWAPQEAIYFRIWMKTCALLAAVVSDAHVERKLLRLGWRSCARRGIRQAMVTGFYWGQDWTGSQMHPGVKVLFTDKDPMKPLHLTTSEAENISHPCK